MYNRNIGTVWHRRLYMKIWCNSKVFLNVTDFSCIAFCTQTVQIRPVHNLSISLDPSVLVFLAIIMYNGNIGTFLHRKFCMKTWYGAISMWVLPIFLYDFLGPNCADTPKSQTNFTQSKCLWSSLLEHTQYDERTWVSYISRMSCCMKLTF